MPDRATLNFSAKVLAMATVISLEEGALETMGCQVCNPHFNPHFAGSTLEEALRIMIVLAHPAKSLSPDRATSMRMLPSSLPSHPSGGSALGRHLLHLLESHHEPHAGISSGIECLDNQDEELGLPTCHDDMASRGAISMSSEGCWQALRGLRILCLRYLLHITTNENEWKY